MPALPFALGVLATSCAAAPTATQGAPSSVPTRQARPAWEPRGSYGRIVSTRFFVSIPVFDAGGWRVDDRTDRWLVASHPASRSMLWARGFREGTLVSRRACEAQGRKWRPDLFGQSEDALTERRPLKAPFGFDSEVAILVSRKGDAVAGVVVVVGAKERQCLLLGYATRADGAFATDVVSERLALVADRMFTGLATRTIDDRARGP